MHLASIKFNPFMFLLSDVMHCAEIVRPEQGDAWLEVHEENLVFETKVGEKTIYFVSSNEIILRRFFS